MPERRRTEDGATVGALSSFLIPNGRVWLKPVTDRRSGRGRTATTERPCVIGLNRAWVQRRSEASRANEHAAPAGTPKAGHRPALRPRANGSNGVLVCHRLKPCLSATPVRSVEGECARSPSSTPKAGRRPALRPRANGNNGAPVCHRLKPCLSATPVRSVEGECARSTSRHTQSRSQTGAPTAQEASGAGLEAVKTAPRDAGRPDPPG